MENPIKINNLGGPPLFLETPILFFFVGESRRGLLKELESPTLEEFRGGNSSGGPISP